MRGNNVLHFVLSFIFVLPVFALRDCIKRVSFKTLGVPGNWRQLVVVCEGLPTTHMLLRAHDNDVMYIQKRTSSGPITIATMRRNEASSVNSKAFVTGVYPFKMAVIIHAPQCDDAATYVCNINTTYSTCQGKHTQVKMDGCRDDAFFPDEEDEKQGQSSGSPPVSTPPPLSDDPPEGANSSGVPIYVVVIVCVTSVLLTAAMYTTVLLIGWTKAKCQSRTLTNVEAEGDYETTTRDETMGENAYCSLTPVQAAYVNININNPPRPSTSTSATSPESLSSNTSMYYSVVTDTVV